MKLVEEEIKCAVCKSKPAVIYCDSCGVPLCPECRFFDLWGYGCGHVDTKVFCDACITNPEKNPYGGKIR